MKPISETTVEDVMRETGFDRQYAEFFLAMERGETEGDVIVVDDPDEIPPAKR